MKGVLKFVKWTLIVLVAVVLVFLLTLPLTITPIVNGAAAAGGAMTGTKISIGKVGLNPFTGNLTVKQVKVGNPEGYSANDLFSVQSLAVDLKMSSLTSDTIEIENIEILDPQIRYETVKGKSNFDAIKEKLTPKGSETPAEKKEAAEQKTAADESAPAKKVVIRRFHLAGAKATAASGLLGGKGVTLPVPELTLTGIGEKSGGVTALEALDVILGETGKQSLKALQGSVKEAVGSLTKETEETAKQLKGLFGKDKDAPQSKEEKKEGGKKLLKSLEGLIK